MKTYFFEKTNGDMFAAEATEADQVVRDPNRRVKLIGVSDGKACREIMREWKPQTAKDEEEDLILQEKKKEIEKRAFEAELAVARGHIEYPPDLSVDGDRDAIQLVRQR